MDKFQSRINDLYPHGFHTDVDVEEFMARRTLQEKYYGDCLWFISDDETEMWLTRVSDGKVTLTYNTITRVMVIPYLDNTHRVK